MIIRQYATTAVVVFFMAFSLGYVSPDAEVKHDTTTALIQAKQAATDAEVKKVADAYAHMSDTERMKGVVYE